MQYLDTYELARLGDTVRGTTPLVQFARLIEGLPDQGEAQAEWAVTGEKNAHGQNFLLISVRACPVLECQRCMQPFSFSLETETRVQLVRSEADLEADDGQELEADDIIERIVGSTRLNVLELIEDEVILGLPYVPKHDVCPSLPKPLAQNEELADAGRPSPFAALSQLKKN